ncbi:MAG: hypothetical protein ABIV51_05855 [Saprospiraceae bacterium]
METASPNRAIHTEKTERNKFFGTWLGEKRDLLVLWLTAKLTGVMIALMYSVKRKKRMSHDNGISGIGTVHMVENQSFPPHEFFAPGKSYPIRIRHASATFLDDAMNCIRSMSVKFSHEEFRSPFDLEMNTGPIGLFWSAASFLQFAALRKQDYGIEYKDYYRKYPEGLVGAQVSLRRNPFSFTNLQFYCQTPFLYKGTDGLKRYAKYRVIPFDDEPETGIQTDMSEWDTCNQRILPDEARGRNYLKYEYVDRINQYGAKYRFQLQVHPSSEPDDPEVFNCMKLWDEHLYPWNDLGIIHITKVLSWEDSCRSSFSVGNMPKTLGILPAKSLYDYNSLNYLRMHAEVARKWRLFRYKFGGPPPPVPDNDNRNQGDWEQPS